VPFASVRVPAGVHLCRHSCLPQNDRNYSNISPNQAITVDNTHYGTPSASALYFRFFDILGM